MHGFGIASGARTFAVSICAGIAALFGGCQADDGEPQRSSQADVAVRISALTDLVVDDGQPGVTISSGWTTRSLSGAQQGSYRYSGTASHPERFVTWNAPNLDDGAYAVYMWWPSSSFTRADAAPVTIFYGTACAESLTVNQGSNGGQWFRLGGANALYDNPVDVKITAADSGYTIADAVRFVRMGASGSHGCAAPDDNCDGVDNDFDGPIDEGYVSQSTSCGAGACAASGSTSCVGGGELDSCTPGQPASDDSSCDGIDDDCDATVDEDCVPPPPDDTCDGIDDDDDGAFDEGYVAQPTSCGTGACAASGSTSCSGGSEQDSCTPGQPAGDDSSCDGIDDDCDDNIDEDCIAPVDMVIDNAGGSYDCCFTTAGGSWTQSTWASDYFGSNYAHGGNNDASKTARWTPDLPVGGSYEVCMWWAANSNRPSAAPVTVAYAQGGTDAITVDQETDGGQWNQLGIYDFEAGSAGYVEIKGAGDGYTIADAVRFVRVGPPGTQPQTFNCNAPPPEPEPCTEPDDPEASESVDWPTYGRGFSNTFANPDETILNPVSVASGLVSKWTLQNVSAVSNPIVVNGILYWVDWDSKLRAHNLSNGTILWERTIGTADRATSTPAVDGDVIYVTDHGGVVSAWNLHTGDPLWAVDIVNPDFDGGAFLWSSPRVVGGKLLVATGDTPDASDRTFRGEIVALDKTTGSELWRTLVQEMQYGPGVSIWSTPAIDEARGVMYVGTGNAYNDPAGPLSDALLALDYANGDLLWWHQYVAGDGFSLDRTGEPDHDIGASPNLYRRQCIDFVGVGGKEGVYRAFNRETEEMMWEATVSSGSPLGGIMATAAYHDGTLYMTGNDWSFFALSSQNWNSTANTCHIQARDAVTGALRWERTRSTACVGAVTYAGGVVYVGTSVGRVYAFDAVDGVELWNSGQSGTDAYRIGSGPTVINGHLIVTEGFQFAFVKAGPGDGSAGGIRVYGLP